MYEKETKSQSVIRESNCGIIKYGKHSKVSDNYVHVFSHVLGLAFSPSRDCKFVVLDFIMRAR